MQDSLAKHGDGTDPRHCARLAGKLRLVDGDYREDATFAALRRALDGAARPCHYLAIPPSLFAEVATRLGQFRLRRRRARRGREAARPRPLERAHPQPRAAPGVRRGRDLPHRPLPRQGAGAEPALLPLRQLDHRAALEPRPRRERADHHGRAVRRRGPRPAVRGTRRGARRGAEPPARRCWRSWRWSRRSARAPRRCATRR